MEKDECREYSLGYSDGLAISKTVYEPQCNDKTERQVCDKCRQCKQLNFVAPFLICIFVVAIYHVICIQKTGGWLQKEEDFVARLNVLQTRVQGLERKLRYHATTRGLLNTEDDNWSTGNGRKSILKRELREKQSDNHLDEGIVKKNVIGKADLCNTIHNIVKRADSKKANKNPKKKKLEVVQIDGLGGSHWSYGKCYFLCSGYASPRFILKALGEIIIPRPSVKLPAVHIHGRGGLHDKGDVSIEERLSGTFHKWKYSEWSNKEAEVMKRRYPFKLNFNNGKLTIKSSGLYLLYVQITMLGNIKYGYYVIKNDKTAISTCHLSVPEDRSANSTRDMSTCSSFGLFHFNRKDTIKIKHSSNVGVEALFNENSSYFGLMKVGKFNKKGIVYEL